MPFEFFKYNSPLWKAKKPKQIDLEGTSLAIIIRSHVYMAPLNCKYST